MSNEQAEGSVQEENEIGDEEEDANLTDFFFLRKTESLFVPAKRVFDLVRTAAKEDLVNGHKFEGYEEPQAVVVGGEFMGVSMKKEKRKALETWAQWRAKRGKIKEEDV